MANKGFTPQIVALRKSEPVLTYEQIARRVGCARATVRYVCSKEGLCKNPTPRNWKQKYFEMRDAHPDWTIYRIAKELGVQSSTLYGLKARSDLGYENVMALGRAAVAAGLTVQQIQEMANARHA